MRAMNKLGISLGFLGVFALGCATASVMVNSAAATPASGSYQCAVFFGAPNVDAKAVAKGEHETKGLWLPAGWVPVSIGEPSRVLACRQAP
jgi:hypothetical protein